MTSNHIKDHLQDLSMLRQNSTTIFLLVIFTSSLMAISSTNWLIIWVSLELNLFSFVPLLLNLSNIEETEASINYFLSQAIGSALILTRRIILLSFNWLIYLSWIILIFAILLKIGVAPCHYWFPTTIERTNWINCLLLATWQKLAPLFILTYFILPKISNLFMIVIAPINAILGGLLGLNQISIKKIIAYSSITHIGWAIRATTTSTPCLSITYFLIYSIIVIPLFIIFNILSVNYLPDLWYKHNISSITILLISVLLISIGGLPPLTGFIPKLLLINILIDNPIIIILLIIGSLINLFFYLNITLNLILAKQEKTHILNKNLTTVIILIIALNLFGLTVILL